MARTLDDVADRIATFTAAWKQAAPNAVLGGMTYNEFIAAVEPSKTCRKDIVDLMAVLSAKRSDRKTADITSMQLMDRVVNTVRGTPEFGPDSGFYRSLGYVTQSERKTGKTHKTKPTP